MQKIFISGALISVLLLNSFKLFSQLENKGNMIDFALKSASLEIPVIEIEAEEEREKEYDNTELKKLKIASVVLTDIDVKKNGAWLELNNKKVCVLGIHSANAKFIGIIFNNFKLPDNAELFIYNTDKSIIRGSYTSKNNREYKSFAVNPVTDNTVYIQLQLSENQEPFTDLNIGQISLGNANIEKSLNQISLSEYCNIDVNCKNDEELRKVKNAVCKLLIGGGELCTGTLINKTTNPEKAYLITAHHCITNNTDANNTVFYFEYEAPYCDGPANLTTKTLSGSTLLATSTTLDFSLVELSDFPPYSYNPYFAGWSRDTTGITNTYSIHHPSGDIKKISEDYDPPVISSYGTKFDKNAFWRIIQWDEGTTEGGSSGGPLFNNEFNLIGVLTGGYAECGSPVNDYYARFDKAWDKYSDVQNQIENWVDPLKSDIISIEGYDPYEYINKDNYTIQNTDPGNVTLIPAEPWGYISGHNAAGNNIYAERFYTADTATIVGFYMNVAKAKMRSTSGKIVVYVWKDPPANDNYVYYKYYNINYFQEGKSNYIQLDNFINVENDFYIGYRLFYLTTQDTFALYTAKPYTEETSNTAMAHRDDLGWLNISKNNAPVYTSLDIAPVLNSPNINNIEISQSISNAAQIFPNPSNSILYVMIGNDLPISIKIFDITGKALYINNNINAENKKADVDVSLLNDGIYILKAEYTNRTETGKFIVRH